MTRVTVALTAALLGLATESTAQVAPGVDVFGRAYRTLGATGFQQHCSYSANDAESAADGVPCSTSLAPDETAFWNVNTFGSVLDLTGGGLATTTAYTSNGQLFVSEGYSQVSDFLQVGAGLGAPTASEVVFRVFVNATGGGSGGQYHAYGNGILVIGDVAQTMSWQAEAASRFTSEGDYQTMLEARVPWEYASAGMNLMLQSGVRANAWSVSGEIVSATVDVSEIGIESIRVVDANDQDITSFYDLRTTGVVFNEASSYATPEPVTMTLLGTGLAGIAAARRRRRAT